jgi:hypothetical protein
VIAATQSPYRRNSWSVWTSSTTASIWFHIILHLCTYFFCSIQNWITALAVSCNFCTYSFSLQKKMQTKNNQSNVWFFSGQHIKYIAIWDACASWHLSRTPGVSHALPTIVFANTVWTHECQQ